MGEVSILRPGPGKGASLPSKLPPLTALRTFVVVARHLSFSSASGELHVTSAAVGQQIRQLEAHFNRLLFERRGGQLLLTPAGQAILPGLSDAFDQMRGTVGLLLDTKGHPLSISVAPTFASKWLVPRLSRFQSAHPDLEIRIDASPSLADFSTGEVDCAVRYGTGDYPGLLVEKLLSEAVFPVASPSLLGGRHPLRGPEDLRNHVLLHDDSPDQGGDYLDWLSWLKAAGHAFSSPGIRFKQSALVLEAAAAGQGVALARSHLVADDLAAGRLVRPFGEAHDVTPRYFFITPPHNLRLPRVRAFRDWLHTEIMLYAQQRFGGTEVG